MVANAPIRHALIVVAGRAAVIYHDVTTINYQVSVKRIRFTILVHTYSSLQKYSVLVVKQIHPFVS